MTVLPLPTEERNSLRTLLDTHRAGDALAAYYALVHPVSKTRLWMHQTSNGRADGFLVRALTGQDLFRPLIALRAPDSAAAAELVAAALPAGQPALFSVPEPLSLWLLPTLSAESIQRLLLFRLNPSRMVPLINLFVQRADSPDGRPRFEIRRGEKALAAAGINWQSADWVEIFVQTEPEVRERGYGKSVGAALCNYLLESRRSILFSVEEANHPSIRLAKSLGFEDTGEREILCVGSHKME